jgi:hypothetical protein
MKLKYAELLVPLFLAGKNFNTKLEPLKYAGLELSYDRAEKELHVSWNGEKGIVPCTNVAVMVEDNGRYAKPRVAPAANVKIKAQVSAPPGIKIED